ncbi:hypothetical protein FE697_003155 [Mumia zhuanghuii]|uniref:Uncharacterized protein n=2 Tax=Mumia TaxID=1546255 RepID=A0ABW1QMY2_9ACTN|nr:MULTISPECIES: hypothetical protein [Mumia]KAA1424917.1 hypothetical protein FE697_003155 [Mumia zhuanghuii]
MDEPQESLSVAMVEAYRDAWARRDELGSDDVALLRTAVRERNIPMTPDSAEADALATFEDFWRRGVPPAKLRRAMSKAFRREFWSLVVDTVRLLRESRDPVVRWARVPSTVTTEASWMWSASTAHTLELSSDGAETLRRACAQSSVDDESGAFEYDVWLRPDSAAEPRCDVMLGTFALGSVRVSETTWQAIVPLVPERTYAGGTLTVAADGEILALDVSAP